MFLHINLETSIHICTNMRKMFVNVRESEVQEGHLFETRAEERGLLDRGTRVVEDV